MKKRRLKSWLPSVGFFLVVGTSTAVAVFVLWIAGEGWYDRLGKPMDRETERVTLGQYSDYLQDIAPRMRSKDAGITAIKKAISIRKQIGDEAGARRASAVLEGMTGEQILNSRSRGIAEDGWTLSRSSQITVSNESSSPARRVLRLGYVEPAPNMPITVTVQRGADVSEYVFDEPGFEHYELSLESGETEELIVTTNKLFRPAGDSRRVGVLVEVLENADQAVEQISGVTYDGWTLDGAPGLVRVVNPSDQPIMKYLKFGYNAPTSSMPTVVRLVDDCDGGFINFSKPRKQIIDVPIPAAGVRHLKIRTDKVFSTEKDRRELGVHVEVLQPSAGINVEVSGLTKDGWTTEGEEALLVINNRRPKPGSVQLNVGYFSANQSMPIEVEIGGLCDETEFEFREARMERSFLLVPPHESRAVRVICDETFVPVDDNRRLGVNLSLVDAAVAKPVVVRGVHRDGWTTDARPARVTIRNTSDELIERRLVMRYWSVTDVMPITVTVKNLSKRSEEQYIFSAPGRKEQALVIAPGQERTWEVSTDKFFQTERDRRRLGVNIEIKD